MLVCVAARHVLVVAVLGQSRTNLEPRLLAESTLESLTNAIPLMRGEARAAPFGCKCLPDAVSAHGNPVADESGPTMMIGLQHSILE